MRRWHGTAAFRHAAAAAAAVNILLLMSANLVGFVTGLDGIGPLAKQVRRCWPPLREGHKGTRATYAHGTRRA